MASHSVPEIAGVLAAYDFPGISTLVDVAGGHGSLMQAILSAYQAIKGVLADVPAVIQGACRHFETCQLTDR